MIFAGVNLLNNTANTRAIVPYDDEEILSDKTEFLVRCHYLYMGKSLLIRAYFVLALYYKHATVS